jgi:hypothetical protein
MLVCEYSVCIGRYTDLHELHNHKSLEGMYVTKTRGKFFQLLIRSDVQCTYSHRTCILEKRVSTMYNCCRYIERKTWNWLLEDVPIWNGNKKVKKNVFLILEKMNKSKL